MSRSFALYQGDRLLMQNGPRPDFGVGDLASQELPYRLVAHTEGNTDLTPCSSRTHTEWTRCFARRAQARSCMSSKTEPSG